MAHGAKVAGKGKAQMRRRWWARALQAQVRTSDSAKSSAKSKGKVSIQARHGGGEDG